MEVGTSAMLLVLVIALLNLVPVAAELLANALERCGFRGAVSRLSSSLAGSRRRTH
jgi:hypothetical protein